MAQPVIVFAESYPTFFARVISFFAAESWQIVRANAIPLGGNSLIALVFLLGIWKAGELVVNLVRKLWPLLILLGTAGAVAVLVGVEAG